MRSGSVFGLLGQTSLLITTFTAGSIIAADVTSIFRPSSSITLSTLPFPGILGGKELRVAFPHGDHRQQRLSPVLRLTKVAQNVQYYNGKTTGSCKDDAVK
jgi:hypothetical protein